MEAIWQELINLLIAVLTTCIGIATTYIVRYLKAKNVIAVIESNQVLVDVVVNGIEQAYKHLNGEEKLELAKMRVAELMKEKGIKISEKEINIMIEASVRAIKESARKELNK